MKVLLSGACTSAMKPPFADFNTPLTVTSFDEQPGEARGARAAGCGRSPPRADQAHERIAPAGRDRSE